MRVVGNGDRKASQRSRQAEVSMRRYIDIAGLAPRPMSKALSLHVDPEHRAIVPRAFGLQAQGSCPGSRPALFLDQPFRILRRSKRNTPIAFIQARIAESPRAAGEIPMREDFAGVAGVVIHPVPSALSSPPELISAASDVIAPCAP